MTYRITGLDPAPYKPLFELSDDELAERGIVRMTVTDPTFPCRISLIDRPIGEKVLLLNHVSHDAAKLILAAIASEHAKEVRRDWVEAELRSQSGKGLAGLVAADQRARNQLREILRIKQDLAERVEAVADGFDLPLVARKVE